MGARVVERYFFVGVVLAFLLLAGSLFLPFLGAIVFAAVLAVLVHPVYVRVLRILPSRTLATLSVVGATSVLIVAPIVVVGYLVLLEAQGMTKVLSSNGYTSLGSLFDPIEAFLASYVPFVDINLEQVARDLIQWISSNIGNLFASTASLTLRLFVTLVVLYYLLKDGAQFRTVLIRFSPLSDTADTMILDKLDRVVYSVIRGTFLIAMLQGALTGVGLWMAGIPNPVLWSVVATVGAIIPNVGTGIVFVPAVALLYLEGSLATAGLLTLYGFLVVGTVDNFIRPTLIGRRVSIHPLLVFLSVLGGLSVFGIAGFVIGPLIIGVLVALADIYASKMHIERSVLHAREAATCDTADQSPAT